MPIQIAVARMEGAKKRGRHCAVWKNESEVNLNTTLGGAGRQAGNGQGSSAKEDGVVLEVKAHHRPTA